MQMKADRTEASQDTHMESKGSAKARATSGRLDEVEGSSQKSQLGGRVRAWQPVTGKTEGKLLDQTRLEANQGPNADGKLLDQTVLKVRGVVNK